MDEDRAHVLVVEDEDDLATLVEVNLQLAGYRVSIARDGLEGLRQMRALHPDLVLLDVMMPQMNGWQVLREARLDPELVDVPIVMLTALAEERDSIQGHLSGAIRYLTKPFDMAELLAAVADGVTAPDAEEQAARRTKIRQVLQRLAELDSGREADATPVSLSKLERLPEKTPAVAPVTDEDRARAEKLTDRQRWLASQMGAGRGARELSEELEVSRSNVYATRKRIARKLAVDPDDVPDEARRLGL